MRIGISISSSYRVEDPRVGARFMIERARVARQVDLDSLFVGDHHVTSHPYYQNTPILGRLLAEWHNKPAGALYLLPLWHPVLLAEQIATLAAIMPGRFIMQCGLGWDPAQSAAMGVDMTRRAAMFEASLKVMRGLWAGETVSEDRFWNIQDARIAPLPAHNVDVWIGAGAPAALHRTARMAEGWIATPSLDRAAAAQQLNQYTVKPAQSLNALRKLLPYAEISLLAIIKSRRKVSKSACSTGVIEGLQKRRFWRGRLKLWRPSLRRLQNWASPTLLCVICLQNRARRWRLLSAWPK